MPPTAVDFIKALHTNDALRNAVHNAANAIADVAVANGYPITREEISDALKAHWKNNTDPTDPAQCALRFSEAPRF